MKKIITIPHTQSVHHTNGMIGGWSDWNLTELGIEQAKRVGENLSKEIKDQGYIMYSSDLPRAKQTAEIISGFLDIEPIFTAALREISCGDANGIPKTEARKIDLGVPYSIDDKQYPGAESRRDLWNRVSAFLREIMANAEEKIIIVSHGVTLSVFHTMWLGLDVEMLNSCAIEGGFACASFMHEDASKKRVISRICDRSYAQ